MRPAREAAICAAWIAAEPGVCRPARAGPLWRENHRSKACGSEKFQVHVLRRGKLSRVCRSGAGHFGSLTPIRSHTRSSMVVPACAAGAQFRSAILDFADRGARSRLWAQLPPRARQGPRVVAKLPSGGRRGLMSGFSRHGGAENRPATRRPCLLEQFAQGTSILSSIFRLSNTLQSLLKSAGFPRGSLPRKMMEKKAADEIFARGQRLCRHRSDPA